MERIKKLYSKLGALDKYILKQIIEIFIMGVVIFTSIVFASDTFITLIKQISMYGIPFHIALMIIVLNLPSVIVMTIPMGTLFATVMTLNRLSLASELTVMRACGVSINRIAKPIFIFGIIMALISFIINETIVPVTTQQSKTLALWSLGQKNIPEDKTNFTFKELQDGRLLKRLFYVQHCKDNTLYNVTVLDMSNKDTIQIIQSKLGGASPKGWEFSKGAVYTISSAESVLNTSWFGETVIDFGLNLKDEIKIFYEIGRLTSIDSRAENHGSYPHHRGAVFQGNPVILRHSDRQFRKILQSAGHGQEQIPDPAEIPSDDSFIIRKGCHSHQPPELHIGKRPFSG